MIDRIKRVAFADEQTRNAFYELEKGKFEDKRLHEFVNRALDELKENPFAGIKIPRRLWPRGYEVDNLFKINLPNGWRLIYTVKGSEIEIVAIVLEWFDHANYGKRFGYKKR